MKIKNISCLSIVIIFVLASLYQCETSNIGKCIFILSDSTIISFHHLKSLLNEDK